jgi:hypothetical protein
MDEGLRKFFQRRFRRKRERRGKSPQRGVER